MPDQLTAVRERLTRHGIRLDPPEHLPGGHLRVTARHGHRAVPYVMPASGSDWRGVLNAVADIRRLLRASPEASTAPEPLPALADTREANDGHSPLRALLGRTEPRPRASRPIWQPGATPRVLPPSQPSHEASIDLAARAMARRMRARYEALPLMAFCRGVARLMGAPDRLLDRIGSMPKRRAAVLVQALGITCLAWLEHVKGMELPETEGWATSPMRGISAGVLGMPRAQAIAGTITGQEPLLVIGRASAVKAMNPPVLNGWPDCADDGLAIIDPSFNVHVLEGDEKLHAIQIFGKVVKELTDGSLAHTSVLHDKSIPLDA